MARLNIDYKQIRNSDEFKGLLKFIDGDEEKAFGRYIRFYDAAQDWYTGKLVGKTRTAPLKSGIPERTFAMLGDLECMLEVGYALQQDDGIHALHEDDQFGWLLKKQKGGHGRAAAARNDDGTFAGEVQDECSSGAGDVTSTQPAPDQQSASTCWPGAGDVTSTQPASSSLILSTSLLKHSPKAPQISGATRAGRRDQCNAAFAEVKLHVLAVYDGYSTGKADAKFLDQAWERLTPLARQLVLSSYESWLVCCREFWGARRQNRDGTFLRDLKASFRANLSRALLHVEARLTAVGCRDGPEGENAHQDRDETPSAGDLSATEGDFDAEAFDEGGGA